MAKYILVTGANKGIGLAIVTRCLRDHEDTRLILGCRSLERAEQARDGLVESGIDSERVSLVQLDTGDTVSCQSAAKKCAEKLGGCKMYAVVNNAGIGTGELAEVLNVNTRGPHRVTEAFLPLLDTSQGRIVNISSGAAPKAVEASSEARQRFFVDPSVTWTQIDAVVNEALTVGVDGFEAAGLGKALGGYGLSKALLNSYTMAVAREHPELKVNACTPGMIDTDIINGWLPWFLPTFVGRALARWWMEAKTPDEGTAAPMRLLFDDSLEGNGRFYGSDTKRSPLDRYRAPGSTEYAGEKAPRGSKL